MSRLFQHWTESSIIPSSEGESVWRKKKGQKQDWFFHGGQIVHLIYEYFRVIEANDSVKIYVDLFTISLRNDNTQEFDSKWDGILIFIPHDDILEGLYKLRTRECKKNTVQNVTTA